MQPGDLVRFVAPRDAAYPGAWPVLEVGAGDNAGNLRIGVPEDSADNPCWFDGAVVEAA